MIGNDTPVIVPNAKFAVSMKKFASRIRSTIAASMYATPTIAPIARITAGSAKIISARRRRPRNTIPNANSTIWVATKKTRPPSARPMTNVAWLVGVSHEGSSVPMSISLRIDIAMPQNAVEMIAPMIPPKKMNPARSSVPSVVASPLAWPFTANALPNRNAGMMNW